MIPTAPRYITCAQWPACKHEYYGNLISAYGYAIREGFHGLAVALEKEIKAVWFNN